MDSELKWKIEVNRKKRGLWSPKIFFGWLTFRGNDNELNIKKEISLPNWYFNYEGANHPVGENAKCPRGSSSLCSRYLTGRITELKFVRSEHKQELDLTGCSPYLLGNVIYNKEIDIFPSRTDAQGKYLGWSLYPIWRPGLPDYGDYVEFIANFICIPVAEEYKRRVLEAEQSLESEEQVITSSDYRKQAEIKKIITSTKSVETYRKINIGGTKWKE